MSIKRILYFLSAKDGNHIFLCMVNTSATKQHHFKYNILTNYESIYFSTSPQVRTQNWCDRPFYCLSEVISVSGCWIIQVKSDGTFSSTLFGWLLTLLL